MLVSLSLNSRRTYLQNAETIKFDEFLPYSTCRREWIISASGEKSDLDIPIVLLLSVDYFEIQSVY